MLDAAKNLRQINAAPEGRPMPTHLEFETAETLDLQLHQDDGEAALHFGRAGRAPLVVTIPLHQLESLHRSIVEALSKEPSLFSSAPRRQAL